jgi:fluoride exporter
MTVLAVVLGGIVGTGLRLGIDALLPHGDAEFPWSTLVINVVGSFLLGMLVARVWPRSPQWLRAGLGAGVLGSFTTFSAVAVSLVTLASAGEVLLAAAYLAVTLIAGLGAAALGLSLGSRREPIGPEE